MSRTAEVMTVDQESVGDLVVDSAEPVSLSDTAEFVAEAGSTNSVAACGRVAITCAGCPLLAVCAERQSSASAEEINDEAKPMTIEEQLNDPDTNLILAKPKVLDGEDEESKKPLAKESEKSETKKSPVKKADIQPKSSNKKTSPSIEEAKPSDKARASARPDLKPSQIKTEERSTRLSEKAKQLNNQLRLEAELTQPEPSPLIDSKKDEVVANSTQDKPSISKPVEQSSRPEVNLALVKSETINYGDQESKDSSTEEANFPVDVRQLNEEIKADSNPADNQAIISQDQEQKIVIEIPKTSSKRSLGVMSPEQTPDTLRSAPKSVPELPENNYDVETTTIDSIEKPTVSQDVLVKYQMLALDRSSVFAYDEFVAPIDNSDVRSFAPDETPSIDSIDLAIEPYPVETVIYSQPESKTSDFIQAGETFDVNQIKVLPDNLDDLINSPEPEENNSQQPTLVDRQDVVNINSLEQPVSVGEVASMQSGAIEKARESIATGDLSQSQSEKDIVDFLRQEINDIFDEIDSPFDAQSPKIRVDSFTEVADEGREADAETEIEEMGPLIDSDDSVYSAFSTSLAGYFAAIGQDSFRARAILAGMALALAFGRRPQAIN